MSSDSNSVQSIIFAAGTIGSVTASVAVGLIYRRKYRRSERPETVATPTRPENIVAWVAVVGLLGLASAAVLLQPFRSAATRDAGTGQQAAFFGAMLLLAIVLGWSVRQRNRRLGLTPPLPMFESAENPPRGWEWDGTRWRRT
jgi:hypothetical protein